MKLYILHIKFQYTFEYLQHYAHSFFMDKEIITQKLDMFRVFLNEVFFLGIQSICMFNIVVKDVAIVYILCKLI